ncbi:LysR family transcriptional regulator [Actinocrinis puniceicyclus]|uniref:LysR family transcriptional regulator n=1 Tax=Actinocrinis puniceicyclus TaxID=977794 RepID=A0A8J8BDC0_9ACTN|nr:LysR family transcriptional regulator [Actinocrinis puniceicyclus]MBS2964390.1 LysR family transcriptional regulator [Actinocrinis puniceicyclus]
MELRQLRYFAVVAEDLHFGRAAERLMIAQSAVSQQIRRLERELGVELFDRSARRVRLTEAGAAFLPAALEVLAAQQRALAVIADVSESSARELRVGTSTGLGRRLRSVLESMRRDWPAWSVELHSAPLHERVRRVAGREWDAAFIRGAIELPEVLERVPIWTDELVAAVPACRVPVERKQIELRELAGMPLYLTERRNNPPLVDLVVEACRDAGFAPTPGPTTGSLEDIMAMLGAANAGWTVVYAAHARQLRTEGVEFVRVRVSDDGAPLNLTTALIMRADAPARRLRPLLDACAEAAGTDLDS